MSRWIISNLFFGAATVGVILTHSWWGLLAMVCAYSSGVIDERARNVGRVPFPRLRMCPPESAAATEVAWLRRPGGPHEDDLT